MTQYEIILEMQKNGYNVVLCGDCSATLLVDTCKLEENKHIMSCEYCGMESEYCDFPDLVYE